MSHKDSLKDIRAQEDGAIKSDFMKFISVNGADVKSRANGNDLLLYIHGARTTTKSPSVGLAKVQHQHDNSDTTIKNPLSFGSISGEKKKFQIKFHPNFGDQRKPQNVHGNQISRNSPLASPLNVMKPIGTDDIHHLNGFKGSPKQFGFKNIQ